MGINVSNKQQSLRMFISYLISHEIATLFWIILAHALMPGLAPGYAKESSDAFKKVQQAGAFFFLVPRNFLSNLAKSNGFQNFEKLDNL